MLLTESLQKHGESLNMTQLVGGLGGQGLQSNNFYVVVNYLICIPCIGTLFLSTTCVCIA
jgi:hypothetical protein